MNFSIEQITYEYGAGTGRRVKALDSINLKIKNQERIGLIGASGAGKSTLLQVMAGLLEPCSGRVLYNGEDIFKKGFDRKFYHQQVGIVFQYPETQLFEETVLKDVMFGPKNYGYAEREAEETAAEALYSLGISKELFDESPFRLSGGEQRRVAIAGVLAMKPKCLLLDEPTAGLEPGAGRELLTRLKHTDTTICFASHNMEEVAEFAARVLVMDAGKIVADGAAREIFARDEEITKAGLELPKAVQIARLLKKEGFAIKGYPMTAEEVAAEIEACFANA